MNEPNYWLYATPPLINGMLDVSRIPTRATIVYDNGRWCYQFKTEQPSNNELHQRESNSSESRQSDGPLDIFSGPFDFKPVDINIKLFQEGKRHLYSIESIKGRPLETPIQRTRSPVALVPMIFKRDSMEDVVNIPSNASHYCWLNGADFIENEVIDADPNEAIMLLNGGLVYLDSDDLHSCRIIQILRFHPTKNGRFRITKLTQWRSEYTQTLLDQDRFVSWLNMLAIEIGLRRYAFINPNEELTSSRDQTTKWKPTENGAFLYLFNDDKSPNPEDCLYELSPDPHGAPTSERQYEH